MMDRKDIERQQRKIQRHRRRIYNVHSPARRKALVSKKARQATKHGAAKATLVGRIIDGNPEPLTENQDR